MTPIKINFHCVFLLVQDMVHPQSIAIPKEFDQKVLLSQRGDDSLPQDSTDDIDEEQSEMAYHVRWQLSRSLTTQHLLTVVSITNTLMNQTMGAHALASSSGLSSTSFIFYSILYMYTWILKGHVNMI